MNDDLLSIIKQLDGFLRGSWSITHPFIVYDDNEEVPVTPIQVQAVQYGRMDTEEGAFHMFTRDCTLDELAAVLTELMQHIGEVVKPL